MKITKTQFIAYCKGFQEQHNDLCEQMKIDFDKMQDTILNHEDFTSMKENKSFKDFGHDSYLYKLEMYCKQTRVARELQGLTNTYE